ncbi:unnamed protein product [Amaranthus hypochondriacus]
MASSSPLKNYNVKPIILGLLLILLSSSSMNLAMARVDGGVVRRMSFEWPWDVCFNKGELCVYTSDCCEGQGLVCNLAVPGALPGFAGRCCAYNAAANWFGDCDP